MTTLPSRDCIIESRGPCRGCGGDSRMWVKVSSCPTNPLTHNTSNESEISPHCLPLDAIASLGGSQKRQHSASYHQTYTPFCPNYPKLLSNRNRKPITSLSPLSTKIFIEIIFQTSSYYIVIILLYYTFRL